MKKNSKETIILILIIVVIPGLVYFTSPLNKIICAHTLSTDDTASLVGMMEEYGVELNS